MEALAAVGIGLSVFGGIRQAAGAKQAGKFNAAVANQEAAQAEAAAAFNEAQTRRQFSRLIASQRAGFGASGVAVDQDTPLQVQMEQEGEAELQALAIRYGGEVAKAAGMTRARLAKFNANEAATGALISAASSLVTGASSFNFGSTTPGAATAMSTTRFLGGG